MNDNNFSRNNNSNRSNNKIPMDKVAANTAHGDHHSNCQDDNHEDDDELLTSGINDIALSPIANSSMRKETFQRVEFHHDDDDDFGDDDDLLAD